MLNIKCHSALQPFSQFFHIFFFALVKHYWDKCSGILSVRDLSMLKAFTVILIVLVIIIIIIWRIFNVRENKAIAEFSENCG